MRPDALFGHVIAYPFEAEGVDPRQQETPGSGDGPAGPTAAGLASTVGTVPARASDRLLPGTGGVYLLTDADERVIQLASTANLARTLRGRLQPETGPDAEAARAHSRRADLSQIVRKVWWRPTCSVFETTYEYWRIARVLMPADYLKQVAFGPAWFVHVDPAAAIPRLVVGKTLRSPPGTDLGPFAIANDATRFVQIIEDAFDLCRFYAVLEKTPHGQACAYFDMGKCPAPCNGSISMSAYRQMMAAALRFARGEREAHCRDWNQQMHEAASRQAFEEAKLLKQHLDRARTIEHRSFERVHAVEDFNYLVLQRGMGRTWVKPFFVRCGWVTPGHAVRLKDAHEAAALWIQEFQQSGAPRAGEQEGTFPCPEGSSREERSEQIWLVSHFLFKKDAPGLFLQASQLSQPAELAERVRECFMTKPTGRADVTAGGERSTT